MNRRKFLKLAGIGGASAVLLGSYPFLIERNFVHINRYRIPVPALKKQDDCRVLLTHNPDSIDTDFKTPVSLILSGHTHGGQVSIPFFGPPVLPVRNKRYSSGLIKTPKGNLFISKGIGCAIYPVRINCAPEIAVLELVTA